MSTNSGQLQPIGMCWGYVRLLDDGSRMSGDVHVRFCERLGVRFPRATHLIVTGASKEILETEVRPLVEQFMSARGLELSQEKTRITHIEEGFDFLGQNVRRYGGKLLIKPSKKNVKAFLGKVRGVVKENKMARQRNLILLLSPIIRGWAQYHRHVVASKTFATVDHRIWRTLWYWSKRRHPSKSAQWVMEKYFRTRGSRKWVFGSRERLPNDTHRWVDLYHAAEVSIRRHPKIKGQANPFDPAWDDYFAQRKRYKAEVTRMARRFSWESSTVTGGTIYCGSTAPVGRTKLEFARCEAGFRKRAFAKA